MAKKEAKAPIIDELADQLSRSSIAILTDYRGMSVGSLSELRRRLRAANVEYRVAKNTLTRFAAERVNKTAMIPDLEGPTAIAFGYDDPAAAAKVVQDYLRTTRVVLTVKGAIVGDRRLSADEVQRVAELPPKPQLQARLVGTIQGPMASLVGTMNSLLSQIAYIVDQRVEQLGGGAAPAADAPTNGNADAADVTAATEAAVAFETAAAGGDVPAEAAADAVEDAPAATDSDTA